jgi:hypothetical protein
LSTNSTNIRISKLLYRIKLYITKEYGRHLPASARNFLGNKKAENYSEIVQELISSSNAKTSFSTFPFGFSSPENMGAVSD